MSTVNFTSRVSGNTSFLTEAVAKNTNVSEDVIESLFSDEIESMASDEEETELLSKAADAALGQEAFNGGVSANMDKTSSFQENIDASSEFFSTYDNLQEAIKNSNTPLTKVQEAQVEKLSKISEKLNSGEYVLTQDIKDATNMANEIITSQTGEKDSSETKTKNNGLSILTSLKSIISKDKNVKEDSNDNILTQNEYDNLKDIFASADDANAASVNLSAQAQQYGIYIAA